jgi:predicted acylesterase/phospholipase RssA
VSEDRSPRRALILAGGGVKVAFQAGVLQVWLDEAGLEFDLADGASGGVFNLAMYCQGMSGTEIAENWRNLEPSKGVQPNWAEYPRLPFARSLFRLDRWRSDVFPFWGLDWDAIRSSSREATFNAYNFSRHELAVRTASEVTEDFVAAAVALPMWFPPVDIDGETYIDAVFITDANLEEAIRRGADELWIIWTVSERSEWHDGFVANYFQIIETAANGHFRRSLHRIEENNKAVAAGEHGEYGRHIEVKLLTAEVPLNYLINFSQDRFAEAVNLGVLRAREWCAERGIALIPSPPPLPKPVTRLEFTEDMKGYASFGEHDFARGYREGRQRGQALMFHLTIDIRGVDRFILDPELEAEARGYVRSEHLGGRRPVERGRFNLFVDQDDRRRQQMRYRLWFRDGAGRPLTLTGFKEIRDHPGWDLWGDTTTLYTRILNGHVDAEEDGEAEVVASGVLRILVPDFLKQLTTFRAEAPTPADRLHVVRRFGQLFMGRLWGVYARGVLPSAPV